MAKTIKVTISDDNANVMEKLKEYVAVREGIGSLYISNNYVVDMALKMMAKQLQLK